MCFHGPVSLIKKVLPFGSQGSSLLILGLDNAGKTTLTARLAGILNAAVRTDFYSFVDFSSTI